MPSFCWMILLSVLALCLGVGSEMGPAEAETLRLGILASLSSGHTEVGKDLRDGALLGIEGLNARWREEGHSIEALVADDRGSGEGAQQAAQRLIEEGKVDLLFGVSDSECALALYPLVWEKGPLWITLATHADLTRPFSRWIFRGNLSDGDLAPTLVDMLWEKTEQKRIALLFEDTAYGRSGASSQGKRIRKYGYAPVAEVSYPRGFSDFTPFLEQIREAEPEGLLIYGSAADAPTILTGLKELRKGSGLQLVASSGWDVLSLLDLPPDLTEGVVIGGYMGFARPDREEELGVSWSRFADSFRARFGRDPGPMAALSYSNLMCLAQAWQRSGFRKERLVEGLEETKGFDTLLEARINYSDSSHDGIGSLHLTVIREGQAREWRRNLFPRDYRFAGTGRVLTVGDYRGRLYKAHTGIAIWMLLHFALGRPPFLRELPVVDEYGLKGVEIGALFGREEKERVMVFRLHFRSEREAVEALNLEPVEAGNETDQRDRERGTYSDGTYWAGYRRFGRSLVLASGGIPREDLELLLMELGADLSGKR